MAQSVNAQLNLFADENYRSLADATEIYYAKLAGFITRYNSGGIGALASADAANYLSQTPSPPDGRPLVTGTNLINFKAAMAQIKLAMDTTLVSGVGTTALAQADIAQVNGLPK